MRFTEPLVLPGYRITEPLKDDPEISVYRGYRERDRLPVILKMQNAVNPTLESLERLKHEYDILNSLRDNRLIQAYGMAKEHNLLVLIMEDIGGTNLQTAFPDTARQLTILIPILEAMAHQLSLIHENGIIHQNIIPANVMVNLETGLARIIDFSHAKRHQDAIDNDHFAQPKSWVSQSGEFPIGNLAYLSPEQTGRTDLDVDFRTDFYALGVVFYELLTGRLPFTATDSLELIHCHLAMQPIAPVEYNPLLGNGLSDIVLKLMAKNPGARYQSAKELQEDLGFCLDMLREKGHLGSFELFMIDRPQNLTISHQLYGREAEVNLLKESLTRISKGSKETILLSGPAGVGKSRLVKEILAPLSQKEGYFVSGKFEYHERDIPYAPIIHALRDLLSRFLTLPSEKLSVWKERFNELLGTNTRLLADVIPEISAISGKLPPVRPLPPAESENRFQLAFRNFISLLASKEHPLVLFLEDLQWMDEASYNLLLSVLNDPKIGSFMLLGSMRQSDDVAFTGIHSLANTLEQNGCSVHLLRLEPLNLTLVARFIGDSLGCDSEESLPLAEVVNEKTGGNPLFIVEYLRNLHREGLLQFNPTEKRWHWDLKRISDAGFTDNLLDFMVRRIRNLPVETQRLIQICACLGSRFKLSYLAIAAERSEAAVLKAIDPALREGLIHAPIDRRATGETSALPTAYDVLEFFHDRLQQACYGTIPREELQSLHAQIARLLFKHLGIERMDRHLFEVVQHFNHGIGHIKTPEEQLRVLRLNLAAGRKAKNSTAYEASLKYVKAAMNLLPNDGWIRHHRIALALHLERAEIEFLCGRIEHAEDLFRRILTRAEGVNSKAKVHNLRTVLYTHLGRYADAVEAGLAGLSLLDMPLPASDNLVQLDIEETMRAVQTNLSQRTPDQLYELPQLADQKVLATIELLIHLWAPASNLNQNLTNLIMLKIVNLSLLHGNADVSSYGYAGYGLFLGTKLGQFDRGSAFGNLAVRLNDRFNNIALKAKVYFVHGAFVEPWTSHLKSCLPILRTAYTAGSESGDLTYASYSAFHIMLQRLMMGDPLWSIDEECAGFEQFLDRIKEPHILYAFSVTRHMIRLLDGRAEGLAYWQSPTFNEEDFLDQVQRKLYLIALCYFYIAKSTTAFIFQDFETAVKAATKAEKLLSFHFGWPIVAQHRFVHAMILASSYADASEQDQECYLSWLQGHRECLRIWSENCPENFEHRYLLVAAETARINNEPEHALDLYDLAIQSAHKHEFTQIEALANEMTARYFLEREKPKIARIYLQDACYCYAHWGATGKINLLMEEFPELRMTYAKNHDGEIQRHGRKNDSDPSHNALDISTFVKASLAISGEIHLHLLLEKLIGITMENAGAQRAVLLLTDQGNLTVEAEGNVERHPHTVVQSRPITELDTFAAGVVHYVFNTQDNVVLGYASKEGPFTSEPYILRHQVKSLLCQPVVSQGQLVAILYLENNLVANAFTADRLEILRMLSAEAAISIQNARLYANLKRTSDHLQNSKEQLESYSRTLEQKVDKRTQQIKEKNAELETTLAQLKSMQEQIIQQEKMASLGTLTAGIAHEIRNPLNFVNNFSEISTEILHEAMVLLNKPDPPSREELVEIAETLTDVSHNLTKISNHGRRAENIVQAMLRHSHGQESASPCPTDMNRLLEEYVQLAYQSVRNLLPELDLEIVTDLYPDLPLIPVVTEDMSRVILNIVENACNAVWKKLKGNPGFVPMLAVKTSMQGEIVEIRFKDNGIGIEPGIRDKIFTPFFTTKPAGQGTGLGLSISYDIIVKEHGGKFWCESEQNKYSEFIIQLPAPTSAG